MGGLPDSCGTVESGKGTRNDGGQQGVEAVPADLDADAEEDEGGQADEHGGSGRAEPFHDAVGVAVAEID